MNLLNSHYTEATTIAQLKEQFNTTQPYKHLVMDNFLEEAFANTIHDYFPAIDVLNKHYKGLNEQKSEGSNFEAFHPSFSQLRQMLMSKEFCQWVSDIVGIPDLFITDDKLGTGLHQGGNGSFLDIHIDFNIHTEKNVHRRLNLLIYMNKDWKDEYGGHLEMWNSNMTQCEKKVAPLFNRCVIFETNEISYHGYSKVTLPEGLTRRSFYAYFYTDIREGATKYHDTVFKPKPEDSTTKKIGTTLKESIKNFTKASLRKIGIHI
ncbi:MAG: 2OG-Fe(II) oxygenase [Cytophagales bacterium]|nr:MAG: 2OG-Fe(II) oxygenase [Cytophagales bacterium]